MEEIFKEFAGFLALGVEAAAVLVIAYGTIQALIGLLRPRATTTTLMPFADKREVWLRFSVWLLLGLEFELAADIVRSAIAPTWTQIGQLAAIAVIRTFLNYFLAEDVEKLVERGAVGETVKAA